MSSSFYTKTYQPYLTIICIILYTMISGCAFSPVKRPSINANNISNSRLFDISPTTAFKISELTLQNMGYELMAVSPASDTITTKVKPILVLGNANCGTWNGNPITGYAGSALVIKIKPIKDQKTLIEAEARFATRFQGRNVYGMVTRDETYRCASLGMLENRFLSSVLVLASNWKTTPSNPTDKPKIMSTTPKTVKKPDHPSPNERKFATDDKKQKLKQLKAMGLISEEEYNKEVVK